MSVSPEEYFYTNDFLGKKPISHFNAMNLLDKIRNSDVLFYPGSGQDISPALRFFENGVTNIALYCDYWQENIPNIINRFAENIGYGSKISIRELRADEFGKKSRRDFMPITNACLGNRVNDRDNPKIGYIGELYLPKKNANPFLFLYFDTEAIQTFINFWSPAYCAPKIIVVQNHGCGGLWTPLDGSCLMFHCAPILPRFLYVGDISSEPWPHYKEVSFKVKDKFSMHRSQRSLWECTISSLINPDSLLIKPKSSPNLNEESKSNPPTSSMTKMNYFQLPQGLKYICAKD